MHDDLILGGLGHDTPDGFRSGFVALVGRPNSGKSTLTNAMVGEKIAITANQPETTRHPVRGIVNRDLAQIVLVDTPGLHRPRTLLGERLNDVVTDTFQDVDVIGVCIPVDEKIGPGDRWIIERVRELAPKTPIIGIVTKIDKASKDEVGAQLIALYDLLETEVVPCSAKTSEQVDVVVDVFSQQLPEGPRLYPLGHVTDEDMETRMSELIREAALSGLRDELPHSVAVSIDEILPNRSRKGVTDVHAVIYVERPGQKLILMGKDNRRMGRIITTSRQSLMDLLGKKIYLDLRIKVLPNWQSNPKSLGRLGF